MVALLPGASWKSATCPSGKLIFCPRHMIFSIIYTFSIGGQVNQLSQQVQFWCNLPGGQVLRTLMSCPAHTHTMPDHVLYRYLILRVKRQELQCTLDPGNETYWVWKLRGRSNGKWHLSELLSCRRLRNITPAYLPRATLHFIFPNLLYLGLWYTTSGLLPMEILVVYQTWSGHGDAHC